LGALVNAQLSPKWLVGPIGMVSVVTHGLSVGATEALNWLAIISLSLGVFNLLPLPIFDGGRLLIDGLEAATGRKISPKVLDVMAYLFVTVVISIAIMATYWDLWRLWKSLG
jgi:regulator of sigma E protease